ncbi:MAG: hypothetical protein J7K90_12425 [Desulfuromusa sp.]|nr:hypothetical protein [Desulfuromusa sp.]
MKELLFCLILLLVSAPDMAQSADMWETKLPFKEATISYQITGTQTGSSTVFLKDYGKTSAIYRNATTKIMGITNQENTLSILTPDWIYNIDLNSKEGTKQINPEKYFIEEFNNLSAAERQKVAANAENMSMGTMVGMDGQVEKNAAKILGYSCDKVTMMGITIYSISDTDLSLKTETNMMGMAFTEVATKINKGSVPAAKFAIPADIQITHQPAADEMAKSHAKMTIQSLLEGKRPSDRMEQYNTPNNQQQDMPSDMKEQMEKMMKMFGGQG